MMATVALSAYTNGGRENIDCFVLYIYKLSKNKTDGVYKKKERDKISN